MGRPHLAKYWKMVSERPSYEEAKIMKIRFPTNCQFITLFSFVLSLITAILIFIVYLIPGTECVLTWNTVPIFAAGIITIILGLITIFLCIKKQQFLKFMDQTRAIKESNDAIPLLKNT